MRAAVRVAAAATQTHAGSARRPHVPVMPAQVARILLINEGEGSRCRSSGRRRRIAHPRRPLRLFCDATFGAGGHSRALLDADEDCIVIAVDQDPHAIARANDMSTRPEYRNRIVPVHGRFGCHDTHDRVSRIAATMASVEWPTHKGVTSSAIRASLRDAMAAASAAINTITNNNSTLPPCHIPDGVLDGIVFDIGMSSAQIDDPSRGFSFRRDGPLDMRMASQGNMASSSQICRDTIPAETIVNTFTEQEIAEIIAQYGEDRRARAIARSIVAARSVAYIRSTSRLAGIIAKGLGMDGDWNKLHGMLHPASRTFQALRMYVNDELGELQRGLAASEWLLKRALGPPHPANGDNAAAAFGDDDAGVSAPGGRIAIISFHSLEDRISKRFLKACAQGIDINALPESKSMLRARRDAAREAQAAIFRAQELGQTDVADELREKWDSAGTTRSHILPHSSISGHRLSVEDPIDYGSSHMRAQYDRELDDTSSSSQSLSAPSMRILTRKPSCVSYLFHP